MKCKGRILIVDDEDRFRNSLKRILEKSGYAAVGAADGMAAMHVLEQGGVDVVLLDSNLPSLPGEDIFMIIREHGMAVEIVLLTGFPVIENALKMMRNGVFDYLAKPIAINQLLAVIGRAVKNKRIRNWDAGATDILGETIA
ncbi:response regulator [Maridesulfovibrio sp.]|uniref:response regulator n=1 Tax=Maridesulfovibrio sp. TaxID=2795000 RepID=UPI0029F535B3|nr:response regulator [Maridesulfovibrio sp.]